MKHLELTSNSFVFTLTRCTTYKSRFSSPDCRKAASKYFFARGHENIYAIDKSVLNQMRNTRRSIFKVESIFVFISMRCESGFHFISAIIIKFNFIYDITGDYFGISTYFRVRNHSGSLWKFSPSLAYTFFIRRKTSPCTWNIRKYLKLNML